MLENNTRRVLPLHWETAFEVMVRLQDNHGDSIRVGMNLFTFMMNAAWAASIPMDYIKAWLPQHLDFTGEVLNQPTSMPVVVAPPSPPSPFLESTVVIEEIGDDASQMPDGLTTEEVARMQAAMAQADAKYDGRNSSDEEALNEMGIPRKVDEERIGAEFKRARCE